MGRPALPMTSTTVLARVGTILIGRDWQRPMARLLGQLHPTGPRETMDPRLIQRWAVGERRVPDWVIPKLSELLEKRATELREQAREADDLAEQLRQHGLIEPPLSEEDADAVAGIYY
ncbi:hypothetical protein [Methylobacterium sp. Leaf85]|uniref:hypothetical protein n=1 Tax=Methylobacterium sp. Leaf85 TaxID=1736241 RepID=UPI000ABB3624|nr:hypothetical protein [Methylobacterium sp. Leaf85]